MAAKISDETMAKILAEAEMFGDRAVIERWGVSLRTIRNYRSRETTDAKFATLCREYRQLLNSAWIDNATTFINKIIAEMMNRAPLLKSKEDAECFNALVGGLKIVGELKIDWTVLTTNDILH